MGQHGYYCDGSLKGLAVQCTHGMSRNAQLQDSYLSTLHDVMEIINAKPCQNPVKNFVV
jgi:hypothetical protein